MHTVTPARVVLPAHCCLQDEPAAAATAAPSPYIPISAHTQQLTPLRLLQIMDALHGPGHNAAPVHPTPTQHTTAQHNVSAHHALAQHASAQHTAAADMQAAQQPMPAHGNGPTLPHSTGSTPSTQAGSSSSGPGMFNLALVDRQDVVVLPAYDGLQPPAEGQQRQ